MSAESPRGRLRGGIFPPAKHATSQCANEEKQRQRQPVAGTLNDQAARWRKEPKTEYKRGDCGGDKAVHQAFQSGYDQNRQQKQKRRRILANIEPVANGRDAQQDDCGEKCSREGSDTKHACAFDGKRGADGKQQESSTDAEETTRHQPRSKASHQIAPGTNRMPWKL